MKHLCHVQGCPGPVSNAAFWSHTSHGTRTSCLEGETLGQSPATLPGRDRAPCSGGPATGPVFGQSPCSCQKGLH